MTVKVKVAVPACRAVILPVVASMVALEGSLAVQVPDRFADSEEVSPWQTGFAPVKFKRGSGLTVMVALPDWFCSHPLASLTLTKV